VKLAEVTSAPKLVWVTDITYLETDEDWMYLAVILDAWSLRVLSWACAPTLAAPLVVAALQTALKHRRPPAGTIYHSDRGSQYTDAQLLGLLDTAGMARNMSRAGNCYDNAMIESFWSTLKTETGMDVTLPATRQHAELAVFDYIEMFYNPRRRHSSLGQLSPVAFELKHEKTNIKAA
jgi:putative transposase